MIGYLNDFDIIEVPMSFISFKDVSKIYQMGEVQIKALDGVSFDIEKGEFVVVLGESGAGKTTILNILGGMDTASSGSVIIDDRDIAGASRRELTDYRRYDIGFVFQFYNLVQNLTAKENVELALQICRDPLDPVFVLKMVGLEDRMNNFPSQLSGGEQQRVAIARAVAKNPKLLLCDEPTGALDYVTGKQVLKVLQDMCYKNGITVVMITHNQALAQMAQKIIRVKSGKIVDIRMNEPVDIEEIEY
jgi:putative ABC transport system ATP-binding protein